MSPLDAHVRAVKFNWQTLDTEGLATLAKLEAAYRTRLPDGAYGYDPVCGAFGAWGGPVLVLLLQAAQQKGGFSSYKSNPYSGASSSISSEGVSFTNSTGKTVSWYPGLGSSTSE